ncbi:MAG: sigma-54 dependent transcriptional regulator [Bacteroides sp.]|nr:sigma-54 dependent transcriptional regulator [Bacteroides sp.]MCM1448500.1 sigma-54 dependent transcriptional regulator [Bacteroides sp.]
MNMIPLQDIKARYSIVGRDEKLNAALDTAIQVARTDLSVLIQGESGVGKEIIPRIIHDNSLRKTKRYIAINCGSIPEGTIDSELFGHEKGSYTGAVGEREGYFGAADGGTLFLDEVGELPMTTQARLLRVLETGEYLRVGSDEPRHTNVRIVAATNVDIPNAIREGKFREDLYYRLCTINIQVPPLRDRGMDSVLLFKMFAMNTANKYHIPEPIRLSPEGERTIMEYKWPGNVRQLKNLVEQMSILEQGVQITPEVLYRYGIVAGQGEGFAISRIYNKVGSEDEHKDWATEIKWLASAVMKLRTEVDELKKHIAPERENRTTMPLQLEDQSAFMVPMEHDSFITTATPTDLHQVSATPIYPSAHGMNVQSYDDIEEVNEEENLNLEEMEKRNIIRALQNSHNRRKVAAQMLGISERTLYRKIKDYGIEE